MAALRFGLPSVNVSSLTTQVSAQHLISTIIHCHILPRALEGGAGRPTLPLAHLAREVVVPVFTCLVRISITKEYLDVYVFI